MYGFSSTVVDTRIGLIALLFVLTVDDDHHVAVTPSGMFEIVDQALDPRWVVALQSPEAFTADFRVGFPEFVYDRSHQDALIDGDPRAVAAFRRYTGRDQVEE